MSERRMRSKSVGLALTLVAAAALTGCGGTEYRGICVDRQTQTRLPDGSCDRHDGYGGVTPYWFYMTSGHRAPAVGSHYNRSSGVYKAPSNASVTKGGVSKSGGKVSSGGFGKSFGKSSS